MTNDISPIPVTINTEMEQFRKDIETEFMQRLMVPTTIINNPFDSNYNQAKMNMISFRNKGVGIPDQK